MTRIVSKSVEAMIIDILHELKIMRTDIEDIRSVMVTKDDLKEELKRFATKDDLLQSESRLSRRMRSYQAANIKHHLETKAAIGESSQRHDLLREGLANVAQSTTKTPTKTK